MSYVKKLDQIIYEAGEIYKNILHTDTTGDGLSSICNDCVKKEVKWFKKHLLNVWQQHQSS